MLQSVWTKWIIFVFMNVVFDWYGWQGNPLDNLLINNPIFYTFPYIFYRRLRPFHIWVRLTILFHYKLYRTGNRFCNVQIDDFQYVRDDVWIMLFETIINKVRMAQSMDCQTANPKAESFKTRLDGYVIYSKTRYPQAATGS